MTLLEDDDLMADSGSAAFDILHATMLRDATLRGETEGALRLLVDRVNPWQCENFHPGGPRRLSKHPHAHTAHTLHCEESV